MRIEEFLSRLERTKKAGAGYQARCPAHPDKVASLSIAEGDDGRVLLKCHASCSTEDIVAKLGLEMKDLFAESGETPRPPSKAVASSYEARTEQVYDYVDEDGEILFQSVRLRDPKEFRQRHRNGEGWVWNLQDVRRVLYRLQDVRMSVFDRRAVWVVEGEKDADALCDLDLTATSSPMGAGKWHDEYTASLEGCPWVLIICDCDEPGRKHAHAVAASVHGAGIRVKVVDLAPDRVDGYDVSDYLLTYGNEAPERLRALAKSTPEWSPNQKPQIVAPFRKSKEFLMNVAAYDDSKDYLGSLLRGGTRVSIAAPTGQGKTTFLVEMGLAAARGTEFLGWAGAGVRVGYVELEMGDENVREYLERAGAGHDNFEIWSDPRGLAIDVNDQHVALLEAAVATHEVVIIDHFSRVVSNEMPEWNVVRRIGDVLDGLRMRYPKTCVVICFQAHQPTTKSASVTIGSIRGFKAFHDNSDVVLTLKKTGASTLKLRFAKSRSLRLGARQDDVWPLVWAPGEGFKRTDERTAADELYELASDEWQSTTAFIILSGKPDRTVRAALNSLAVAERIEARGDDIGGRGHQKEWRRTQEIALAV